MITAKQIAGLKYLIHKSADAGELTKKILIFLIHNSLDLTKEVCLTLNEHDDGFSSSEIHTAALGLDSMQSSNGVTYLDQVLITMGSDLCFSVHYGDYDPLRPDPFSSDGQFAGWPKESVSDPGLTKMGMPMRYTFWFAKERYSRVANLIKVSRNELAQINLAKPGLYPNLETGQSLTSH